MYYIREGRTYLAHFNVITPQITFERNAISELVINVPVALDQDIASIQRGSTVVVGGYSINLNQATLINDTVHSIVSIFPNSAGTAIVIRTSTLLPTGAVGEPGSDTDGISLQFRPGTNSFLYQRFYPADRCTFTSNQPNGESGDILNFMTDVRFYDGVSSGPTSITDGAATLGFFGKTGRFVPVRGGN